MTFTDLKLTAPLLKAVKETGYETPTPIQAKAIPPVLDGHDLLGCAQTGTGKTAAFALPILQNLAGRKRPGKGIRALILTPTRELALQIDESFADYGKYVNLQHTVIFGGVGQAPQVAALQKGVDILTACPGRLNDLIGQGYVDLSTLEIFVLDEADRMLDMGFIHDVKKVLTKLPKQRQTLFFSATMPKEIEQLAATILHEPVFVKVDPVSSTVERIDQSLYNVSKADKRLLLAWLLKNGDIKNALVFSRTKHGADRIAKDLNKAGISAAAIHGNKSQNARVAALDSFKSGQTRVLVATDIAARGIDINELSHVFNFDLPEVPETYVHRIGRTARAGADGVAISFCCPDEAEYLAGIEKLNRKKIPVVSEHPWAAGAFLPPPPKPAPPLRGRRPAAPAAAPAPKARAAQPQKEEPAMEKQPNKPAASRPAAPAAAAPEQGDGLSTSARRRRRRRRSGQRGEEASAPVAEKAQAPAAQQPRQQQSRQAQPRADKPAQQAPRGNAPAKADRQNANGGRQPAGNRAPAPQRAPQAQAPRGGQPGASRPARGQSPRAQQPAAQPKRSQPVKDEDPGLLLISRRPPQQKFASFDEYMAARGGVTAPIKGEDQDD